MPSVMNRQGLWKVLRKWGGALMNAINTLTKDPREIPQASFHVRWGYNEKSAPQKRALAPPTLTPWFWTSSPQTCEKEISVCHKVPSLQYPSSWQRLVRHLCFSSWTAGSFKIKPLERNPYDALQKYRPLFLSSSGFPLPMRQLPRLKPPLFWIPENWIWLLIMPRLHSQNWSQWISRASQKRTNSTSWQEARDTQRPCGALPATQPCSLTRALMLPNCSSSKLHFTRVAVLQSRQNVYQDEPSQETISFIL